MLVTTQWISEKYNKFNKAYFGGKLPSNLEFKVCDTAKYWGYAAYHRNGSSIRATSISISNRYDSPESVKENVLLHEMIHILDYSTHPEHFVNEYGRKVRYNAHGVWFNNVADRLNKEFGLHICDHVTKEEETKSKAAVGSRSYNRALKGYYVIFAKYENGIYMMTANEKKAFDYLEHCKNSSWCQNHIGFVSMYFTHSEKYAIRENSTRRGHVITVDNMNKIVDEEGVGFQLHGRLDF